MKMTRKIIALILCLCLAMTAALALASCDKDDDGDGGNNSPAACQHVGTLICENCFEPVYDLDMPAIDADELSVGIIVEDVQITVIEDYYPETEGTVTLDFADIVVSVDATTGEMSGCGEATINMVGTNTGVNNTLDVYGVIEGSKLYAYAKGAIPSPDEIEELEAYVCFDLEKAMISGEGAEQMTVLEAIAPAVIEWAADNLVPVINAIANDEHLDYVTKPMAKLINAFFTAKDGKVSLDFGILKTWNDAAATKKASEFIDALLGEGTYGGLKALLTGDDLYNLNVGQVIDYIQNDMGIDIAALFYSADAFATELMTELGGSMGGNDGVVSPLSAGGASAVEPGILSSMLMEYTGMSINEILVNEELRALSVSDAIAAADMTVAEVKSVVSGVFTMLENATVYELVFQYGMSMETVDADTVAAAKAQINEIVDLASSIISLDFTVANGVITKTEIDLDLSSVLIRNSFDVQGMLVSISIDKTGAVLDCSVDIPDVVDGSLTYKIVLGYEKAVDAAKLDSIKAEIDKAPTTITADMIEKDGEGHWDGVAVEIDPETGDAVAYYYDLDSIDSSVYEGYQCANGFVYFFNINDVIGIMTGDGCGDLIDISYAIANAECYDDIELVIEEGEVDEQALLAAAIEATTDSYDYYSSDIFDVYIVYDPVNDVIYSSYTHSHNMVIDEEKSQAPEGCYDVGKNILVCSECGREEVYFYSEGHSYENVVSGSLAEGYTFSEACENVNDGVACDVEGDSMNLSISGDGLTDNGVELDVIKLGYTASETVVLGFDTDSQATVVVDIYNADGTYVGNLRVYDDVTYTYRLSAGEYVLEISYDYISNYGDAHLYVAAVES